MHTEKKIALLHYWLLGMRGGEIVLEELCRMFPEADLYTHAVIHDKISPDIRRHSITESLIGRLPMGRTHCQKYLPLMPFALRQWDFSRYDLIISSESGPVKGIRKPAETRHICYCHTPMRYLWDMYDDYYQNAGFAGKVGMSVFKNYLRNYDLKSAECVDTFIANSNFVAERIKRIYDREATVIYPPVDVDFFIEAPILERKHYLFVGQLVCYKRPDLAVEAFRKLQNETLIIVGEGPMRKELEAQALPNVIFTGRCSREKLRELYASAKGLIFSGIEDFGIVPVEAIASGCPVIAMNIGGTAETVIDGVSGILMNEQSSAEILTCIEKLNAQSLDTDILRKQCLKFHTGIFQKQMIALIEEK